MAPRPAALALLLLVSGGAAATAGGGASSADSACEGSDGTCPSLSVPAAEHLLLQTKAAHMAKAEAPEQGNLSEPDESAGVTDAHPPISAGVLEAAKAAAEAAAMEVSQASLLQGDGIIGKWTSSVVHSPGLWCQETEPPADWTPFASCPTLAQPGDRLTVKVLTYNLYWWRLFGQLGGNGQSAGHLIASTSGPEQYDFMGFQECDDKDRILRDAKAQGLQGDYVALGGEYAVAMAYNSARWTLLATGTKEVGEDSSEQYYGKRIVRWGRFRHTGGKTVFFVDHHGPLPVSGNGGCTGSATMLNILDLIATEAHTVDAVILLGDFNARTDSTRVQAMDKHMTRVYSGTAMGGVDHIYTNCPAEAVGKNLGQGGSDHDALSVTFKL